MTDTVTIILPKFLVWVLAATLCVEVLLGSTNFVLRLLSWRLERKIDRVKSGAEEAPPPTGWKGEWKWEYGKDDER